MINKFKLDINDDLVKNYYKSLSSFKSLDKKEEHELLKKYRANNDINARNKLVTSNLKYVFKMASKYIPTGIPLRNLISEANDALLYSIDKFDEKQDVKLLVYSKWWINQRLNELVKKNNALKEDDLLNEKNEENIHNEDGVYVEDYETQDSEDDFDNNINEEKEILKLTEHLVNALNDRERDMVKMRFGLPPYNMEYKLEEIGKKYNVTKERARKVVDKAILSMKVYALANNYTF